VSLEVYFRPEAERDIEDAAAWYEKQQEGLGSKFLDEISSTSDMISKNPDLYPVIYRRTRRAIIQRFPFAIYYRVEKTAIVVIAVMHGSRHPRRWQKRTR